MTDYQITLPLGMSIGDADTGTYALVSGRIYKCTNIDQEVVAPIVGYTTGESLGVICLSASINKWAAFKPYRNLSGAQDGTPFNGMHADPATDEIEYEKPNSVSGYGLEEFFGYNHNAPVPGIAAHGPVGFNFQSNITHEINCRLDLTEFDLRTLEGTPVIERVYAKTYIDDPYTLQRTESVEITDADVENQEIYMTAKVESGAGSANRPFKIVFTVGIDIDNDCNYPSAAGGELALTGTATYAAPPSASLGLGSSFDPADVLTAGVATINTSREYEVSFGDGSNWIDLDAGGTYDGPFDIIARKGPAGSPDWEVTVAEDQNISIGKIPNYRLQGQLDSAYTVGNDENIAFRIEKST